MLNLFNSDKPKNIQNIEWSKAPDFAVNPVWFLTPSQEKCVKIGKRVFNYMDFLEGWCGIDCYTYRSSATLERIYQDIKKAFEEVDEYEASHNLKNPVRKLFKK